MLNYPNYLRNVAPVPAIQKDGEHRYYLPKKYRKKNEALLVKEFKCGCHDIYKIERIEEKWSQKYKKSINCSNPKGFSQKAHCQGRKKQENFMKVSEIQDIIREEIAVIKEDNIKSFCQHNECAEQAIHMYEKKDACYHKVKARYDVWPSAYASGALVKCRKVGAKNWGNKSKKKEGFASDAQRRAAFASGYEEKGKKKKKESVIKENPVVMAATHGAMNVLKKQQKKVPGKGGKPVAMTTALKDKTQPSHNKVKGIFKKLVDKLVKKKKAEPKQKQSQKDIDFYKKQFTGESYDIFSEDGGWGYTMTGLVEAEYQGRKVKLGKPMQGDTKKFKVYVKNPKGNVVKVNFGQGGDAKGGTMRIRKSNPKARANFRARHNCDNPGPRHKARYWSCRKW